MKDNVDIKTLATQRAIATLKALGAKMKVIMPDGSEFGDLKVVIEEPRMKRGERYGHGTIKAHVETFIGDMAVSDVREVPVDRFDLYTIQRGISSYCASTWGNGSAITMQPPANGTVEVLRVS